MNHLAYHPIPQQGLDNSISAGWGDDSENPEKTALECQRDGDDFSYI